MVLSIEVWTCLRCKRKHQRLSQVDSLFQRVLSGFFSPANFHQTARLLNSRKTCIRGVILRKNRKLWLSPSPRTCIQWPSSPLVFSPANQAVSSHRPIKTESIRPNTGSQPSRMPLIFAPKSQESLPSFITTASVIIPRFQTWTQVLITVPTSLTSLVLPIRTSGSLWDYISLFMRKLPSTTYF